MIKLTKHQKRILARIIISALLLLVAVSMPEGYASLAVFIVAYLVIGYEVLLKAASNISSGQIFDENFLMAIATIGAFFIKQYPEAVAVMLFYEVGELFQGYAVERSRESISQLMDMRPEYANVERDGQVITVAPSDVAVNEIIVIKPGERVPLDGVVVDGATALDMASLTGESLPVDVSIEDMVLSGSINTYGVIKVLVDRPYEESTVAGILELVENTSLRKAKTERLISRFSRYYTPAVVFSALLLALIPPLLFSQNWNDWISRALVFLVISCPCALVLSVPLSFFSALGSASKNGVLVKGGVYLETLAKAHTVVFDKTGTLTKGIFKIAAIHPNVIDAAKLLEIAALAESFSNHPISISLKEEYSGHIDKSRVSNVEEIAGHGVKAVIDGHTVLVGNEKLMEMENVSWHKCTLSGTTVHVASNGEYMGHIVISDDIKPDAKAAVRELKSLGVQDIIMLTGDSKSAAVEIAEKIGLEHFEYSLLPKDKTDYVQKLMGKLNNNETLVFVGDGINDAPVLVASDIGISMGHIGSHAAIEASDIVIMDDMPSKIAKVIKLAKKTVAVAKQNMVFAIGVKLIVLALGAFGLASLWLAVFADVGVSILAVMNSIRLLKK